MAVRITIELEASADEYDRVNAVAGEPPDGLIVHTAVDKGGQMKVVDVWESADKFATFVEKQLGPAVVEVLGDDGPKPGAPEIEEIYNLELHGS